MLKAELHAESATPNAAQGCARSIRIPKSEPAFTLLELALVIALLVMLAVMAMPMFAGAIARHQLVESAEQLRSLMFLARATATGGQRLEIRFVDPAEENYLAGRSKEETGPAYRGLRVLIERDPMAAPGAFDEIKADWARWQPAGQTVQVSRIEVSEPIPAFGEQFGESGPRPPTILFGCDGRSQVGDVTISLMNDRLDGYLVQLRGATGIATIGPMPEPEKE